MFNDFIKNETLAVDIINKENDGLVYDLNGHNAYLLVERVK